MTKRTLVQGSLAAVFALLVMSTAQATDYENKQVIGIQTSGAVGSDCYFFQLQGVTSPNPQAHPLWFAVHRINTVGAKDTLALVLSAKLTGMPVSVRTTTIGCGGYAMADIVWSGP